MGGSAKIREPSGNDNPKQDRERQRTKGGQEALPGRPAPRREAGASGNQVASAYSPKDILMEVPVLPSYVNLNAVCLCPTEHKGH